jgi:hypothetical protein
MAKASAAEVARRIDELRPLLVECLSLREIRSATVKGTSWGASVSLSQLKRYLAKAREQIKEAATIDREQEIGATRLRYERVIAKAAAKGDLRSELTASKQLCELFGLEAQRAQHARRPRPGRRARAHHRAARQGAGQPRRSGR